MDTSRDAPSASELDPLVASEQIREDYLRYVQTAFPMKDPLLRDAFRHLIRRPGFLVKGPYLEGTPPLRPARSIRQLIADGILCKTLARIDGPGFPDPGYPVDRPLYAHQERAVRKIVAGRNVVVATGTGSGKTEAFLIPIIDSLLREGESGTLRAPGVRALLLYPMNALANDQLKRLRRLLANTPTITFGRYTGQTLGRRDEAEEDFRRVFPQEPRVDNELICRDDIRERPPHILLTNYAMLEYLLMRPHDTRLFDDEMGRHWKFIVLDEAHTYSGAAGMEVGMLLRRLRDRVVKSRPSAIRCVVTSATLGRGRSDFPQLVRFATQLFGDSFEWDPNSPERQDVVEAEFQESVAHGAKWGRPNPGLYARLQTSVNDVQAMASATREGDLPEQIIQGALDRANGAPAAFLHGILQGDERVHDLRAALREKPVLIEHACASVFGDKSEDSRRALVSLVARCARARERKDSAPLIPARYHLFVRSLAGGLVTFPRQDAPHLHLEAVDRIEEDGRMCQAFEIATCTRCGQVFLTGTVSEDWVSPRPGEHLCRRLRPLPDRWSGQELGGEKQFFTWDVGARWRTDEDEAVLAGRDLAPSDSAPWTLCTSCGAVQPGAEGPDCGCDTERRMLVYAAPMRDGRLGTCPSCGAQTRHEDVAHRVLTGQDAPVAVMATSLYQLLPPDQDACLPGQGRKLLCFSDSRQDAAYFAPYLEGTHKDLLHRRLILQALDIHRQRHETEPARPLGLADTYLRELTRDLHIFEGPSDPAQEHKERCTWVFQELLSFERRIGLEGSGLLAVGYTKPRDWQPPRVLTSEPWNLEPASAWALVEVLLDTLRFSGGLCIEPADVTSAEFQPRNRLIYCREIGADAGPGFTILGWLPRREHREHVTNRRFDYLVRLIERRTGKRPGDPALVGETLKEIWRSLTPTRPLVLKPVMLRDRGYAYHIDPKYVELRHGGSTAVQWFRCTVCRTLAISTVDGVCPTMGCTGTMETFDPAQGLADHHYRELYLSMNPVPMRVREHTAQWCARKAAEIQQQFLDGEVNVLSCSTTFELGVDVGQLQAVLMRNVPPSTARYVQRAGRAGRRTDAAAFSLTYAQRRPHDLTHFASPEQFIAGRIKAPAVELRNGKIVRRHVHAVALAEFFRRRREMFGNVGGFFASSPGGPELLRTMLDSRPTELLAALRRVVPEEPELRAELDLESWGWVPAFLDGELAKATDEVRTDLTEYEQLEQEASRNGRHELAAFYQRQGNRVRRRELLGFLASRNVLPKYGFPVDVVELQLRSAHDVSQELELQRDLKIAISEYAPGGQVVAGHLVWESTGLRRLPRREPEEFSYVICPHCGRFHKAKTRDGLPQCCEACGGPFKHPRCRTGTLVIPAFGFFSNKKPESVGRARPQRLYSSRAYFSEYGTGGDEAVFVPYDGSNPKSAFKLSSRHFRQGRLAVVNGGIAGAGFSVCQRCGFAEPVVSRAPRRRSWEHQNAYGKACDGPRQTRHIGHEFLTDVIELRFSGPPIADPESSLWLSLTYALLEGASQALGIDRDDIDGCLYPYAPSGQAPAIILYDSIPGGAGHVRRVGENLAEVLREAHSRVAACEQCDREASCYACLKNYDNQFCHHLLRRGFVIDFLGDFSSTV